MEYRNIAAAVFLACIVSGIAADVVGQSKPVDAGLAVAKPQSTFVDCPACSTASNLLSQGQALRALRVLSAHLEAPLESPRTAAAWIMAAQAHHSLSDWRQRDVLLEGVLDSDLPEEVRDRAARVYGAFLYEDGRHEEAVALWERRQRDGLALDLLERLRLIWLYSQSQEQTPQAWRMFVKLPLPVATTEGESRLYRVISRRLFFRQIDVQSLGLLDGNVSALAQDYDDLWIGTWAGGLARYTFSTGTTRVFEPGRQSLVPTTVRSIVVTPSAVWVGAYDGLFAYDKLRAVWREVRRQDGRPLEKVQSVMRYQDSILVATAGTGMWAYRGGALQRVLEHSAIGPFVNSLSATKGGILAGTLDRGAFLIRPEDSEVTALSSLAPGFDGVNVTCFVMDGKDVWIGTYGDGLYRWDRRSGTVGHFRRVDGSIPDDWILAGAATAKAVYFGTFGGGVAVFDKGKETWRALSIRQGLSTADVASVGYWEPNLYFGTLGGGITVFDERGYATIP